MDGSPRSYEAHQEGVRRRLLVYIHEEMKTYSYRPIVTSDTLIERYCNN